MGAADGPAAVAGADPTDGDSVVPRADVSGVIDTGAADWSVGVLSMPAASACGVPPAGGVKLPATVGGLAPPVPNQTTS